MAYAKPKYKQLFKIIVATLYTTSCKKLPSPSKKTPTTPCSLQMVLMTFNLMLKILEKRLLLKVIAHQLNTSNKWETTRTTA